MTQSYASPILPILVSLSCFWLLPAKAALITERAALEKYLQNLHTMLETDVCVDKTTAQTLLSGSPVTKRQSVGLEPSTDLADRLKQTVVMVITHTDSGSGFFIDGQHVVTNHHVISSAGANGVLVAGAGLGGVRQATIVASVAEEGPHGRDFAILRVAGPPSRTTLPLSETTAELDNVIAAGFPALVISNDIGFKSLTEGNASTLPGVILSRGSIMAVQNRHTATPIIAHSAAISGGSSGGPLVDLCGRVVGINTFIQVNVKQASNTGYAVSSNALIHFLSENGIKPAIKADYCEKG